MAEMIVIDSIVIRASGYTKKSLSSVLENRLFFVISLNGARNDENVGREITK